MTEIFSPVARYTSICTLVATDIQYDFHLHQMDVQISFINGKFKEDFYMKQLVGIWERRERKSFT